MKKKVLIIISIIFLILLVLLIFFLNNKKDNNNLFIKNDLINDSIYILNKKINNDDVVDLKFQKEIDDFINKKKKKKYNFNNPLLIINPYQTIVNGLYIYFNCENKYNLEYSIEVKDYPKYTNMLVNNKSNVKEGIIVGLIQGKENILKLKLLDEKLNTYKEKEYIIKMPILTENNIIDKANINKIGDISKITPGLFGIFGIDKNMTYNSNQTELGLYDNNGILRLMFFYNSGKNGKTLEFTNDNNMIVDYKGKSFILLNNLGKIIDILGKITLTHGYQYINDKMYYASGSNDFVYEFDLKTHKEKELIDFKKLLPDIYEDCKNYVESKEGDQVNWLHNNSIALVNSNDILVSSRERSTIFYVENIFTKPQIKYMIGPEILWNDTKYKDLLLKKDGNFNINLGQHTIRYENSNEKGKYYIYMFNNNEAKSTSIKKSNWIFSFDDTVNKTDNNINPTPSKFYKYLVDENTNSFKLVESFDVTFSNAKGNVLKYFDNYVLASPTSFIYSEYTNNGDLIIQYDLIDKVNEFFRTGKYDFKNIFFSNKYEYVNYNK